MRTGPGEPKHHSSWKWNSNETWQPSGTQTIPSLLLFLLTLKAPAPTQWLELPCPSPHHKEIQAIRNIKSWDGSDLHSSCLQLPQFFMPEMLLDLQPVTSFPQIRKNPLPLMWNIYTFCLRFNPFQNPLILVIHSRLVEEKILPSFFQ